MRNRHDLRSHYRQIRNNLTSSFRTQANLTICRHLAQYPPLQRAKTIAAYCSTPEEVDLNGWIATYLGTGGVLLLPRLGKVEGEMTFHIHRQGDRLVANRFGIQEPPASSAPAELDIDVIILPLLAFDDAGTRLGMGGGYYDRYLEDSAHHIHRVGVAFSCQHAEKALPRAAWDVPLDAVVTEKGVLEFAHSPA